MDLAKGLLKAYETKWSYVNSFRTHIQFAGPIKRAIGWTNADEENINLNIVSIDTPQFSNQSIEVFVADRWKVHSGRDELYRFSITFRDQDQMKYYKKFVTAYFLQKRDYFDNVKMNISLYKDADYWGEKEKKLYEFENTMIESVSQLQFSNNTEAQIAEFTVQFKCTTPKLSNN
jgi:hypothetical protein